MAFQGIDLVGKLLNLFALTLSLVQLVGHKDRTGLQVRSGFFELEVIINNITKKYQTGCKKNTDQTYGSLGGADLLCRRSTVT
jgi:hypothetical protein